MKRKTKLAIWSIVAFLFVGSGLAASLAWFNNGRNEVDVDVTGSVVEEYFHCGDGSQANPYVITRPIHYYHLVEFFQRETTLTRDGAHFGTDYLYFQVGYDIDNDGDLEVYAYDDQGIYQGTVANPSYSTTLNMAYYSGTNALLPIGTNEIPFIGSFNGNAPYITIANLNIHCAETVQLQDGTVANRSASDIGVFGYVADKVSSNTRTIIQNAYFDGLTIDLSDVSMMVASPQTSVSHETSHADEAYVGLIAGHVHSYTNYLSASETNASPLSNVYVTNASVQGGAGVRCNYGYIGKVDTVDADGSLLVGDEITTLMAGGGQGENFGEGGTINPSEYQNWLYNGPRDGNAALIEGDATKENHITKSGQYELHYTVSNITNINKDFLFLARSSDSKVFYFYQNTGVFYNGANHPFSWTTHNGGTKPKGKTNYQITFDSTLTIGSRTNTVFYLNYTTDSGSTLKVYSVASGSRSTDQVESTLYTYLSNIIYRLKDNYNSSSGDTHKTYIPLKFTDAARTEVSDDNTGYIVGTSLKTDKGADSANGSPKLGLYGANFISNSLGTATHTASDIIKKGSGNATFNDSQVEILTYSTNDNDWVAVKDSHNSAYYGQATSPKNGNISSQINKLRTPEQLGFKKYEAYASDPSITESSEKPLTRNSLRNLMTYEENGVIKPYYHISGIHFDTATVTATGKKYGVVANSADHKVAIPRAHLNGLSAANSTSYELLTGAINFFFPSKGFINFFAGTYNSSETVLCNFFSLYKIVRSQASPNQISSIHEIVGVYKKKNGTAGDPYVYKVYDVDSDGDAIGSAYFLDTTLTESELELIYDVDSSLRCGTVHRAPVNNALYYFEVPINPGEYAMGVVSNSTNAGAYLIYLDIGANSDVSPEQPSGIRNAPLFTQIDFQTNSFVINSCFNVAYVIPSGATKETFIITVSCAAVTYNDHSYTCYELEIVNTTGSNFEISCLLMDNDSDPTNDYYYMYAITYNSGTKNQYLSSNIYTGGSGGTSMAPTYS